MRLKKEVGRPHERDPLGNNTAEALLIATMVSMFVLIGAAGHAILFEPEPCTEKHALRVEPLEPIKVDGNTSLGDIKTNLEPTRTTLGVGWIPHQDRVSAICNDYGEWIGCKASDCVYGWALRKKDGWNFACGRAEDVPAYCPGTDGGLARCDENVFADRVPGYDVEPKFRDLVIGDGKGGVIWTSHGPFKVGTP